MNFVLHGTAVSAGITIGHAHLVSSARLEAAHYEIPETAVQGGDFPLRRRDRARQAGTRRAGGADPRGRAGRVRHLHQPAPHDPGGLFAVAGAARAHPRAPHQRRVGAGPADGNAGRAVRGDGGSLPARAAPGHRAGRRAGAEGAGRRPGAGRAAALGRGQPDRGRARPVAGGHDPVQAPPVRRLRHRRRRRDFPHRDRRAQPQHPGAGRPAPRAPHDPGKRPAHRRRPAGRAGGGPGPGGAGRVPAAPVAAPAWSGRSSSG